MYNTAVAMFERTAKAFPDNTAVKDGMNELTFKELRLEAIKMASSLLDTNTKEFSPILVYFPESVNSIVSFLAAMYSASVYVPIADNTPIKRLESILSDFENARIITDENGRKNISHLKNEKVDIYLYEDLITDKLDENAVYDKLASVIDTDPLYIIFTSGSTGVPKGVTISHRGAMDYAMWLKDTFDFSENTILANQAPFYFDNSVLDIYTMMYTGARLLITPRMLLKFADKLVDFLSEEKVNTIFWVPTMMISLASEGVLDAQKLKNLKTIIFAGEVMPNKYLNMWRKELPDSTYANLYGPTEITVDCTYYIVDREFADHEPLPIGKPCKNTRVYILDDDGREVESGETGLIHVAGSCLSLGYWNKKEKTDEVFIKNPLKENYTEKLYNTGDLGYYDKDGNIIFAGRKDSQIKHRGNRIELGEIENAAQSLAYVENSIVLHDALNDDIVLIVESEQKLMLRKLNMDLKKIVPSYMCPTRLEILSKLPMTINGKIDRVKLKEKYLEN